MKTIHNWLMIQFYNSLEWQEFEKITNSVTRHMAEVIDWLITNKFSINTSKTNFNRKETC